MFFSKRYALLIGQNRCVLSSKLNINADLKERIECLQSRNNAIKFICLFADDGYFISNDEGMEWGDIILGLDTELLKMARWKILP